MSFRLHAFTIGAACLLASGASAAQGKQECLRAFDEGQDLREALHLQKARERFMFCAQPGCWAPIQKDCTEQLEELLRDLPTIVPGARLASGEDVLDVAILVDGERVKAEPGGHVAIDPGRHVLTFERSGYAPVTKEVVIRLGEHNRPIVVTLTESAAPAAKGDAGSSGARVSPWAYVFAGIGAVSFASFGYFAVSGMNDRAKSLGSCAPACPDSDESRVRTQFIAADVSLALGVVAAGIATYLFLQPALSRRPARSAALRLP